MRRNKLKNYLVGVGIFLAFIVLIPKAQAATLFLSPGNGQVTIGQSFEVEVRINSSDQGFNAAQATIQFPSSILEVKAIDSSSAASVFNFWLTGPSFSNSNGQITFLGGTSNGVVGASLEVLKITFVAKTSGEAKIVASDAAITASDGSGTNILNTVANATFLVSPATIVPITSTTSVAKIEKPVPTKTLPVSTPTNPVPTEIVTPVAITRPAVVTSTAPSWPEITVPFYPDQTKWYNQISNFLVKWKLPNDILGISAVINKNSKFDPPSKSEGLYDAKAFEVLKDGLWYVHVKLKNNVDWGPTGHYKIAIDTMPPLAFSIEVADGLSTDNPKPTLNFKTNDGLSGIANYIVKVDNGEDLTTTTGTIVLPPQTPGKKKIVVRAVDNAGNIREANVDLEILPIASPTISTFNKNAFSNESDLAVSGTALSNSSVWLSLISANGSLVAKAKASVDNSGNWGTQFSGPFKKGVYFVEAITQDSRGALSLSVKTDLFNIKEKPLLTIGGVAITQFWFFMGLVTVLLLVFIAGWWAYHLWREQLGRKTMIAQRDIVNVFTGMENDLNKLIKVLASSENESARIMKIKFILKSMKNNLSKAQKYIGENIKEISE
jgi:hypothetical protein